VVTNMMGSTTYCVTPNRRESSRWGSRIVGEMRRRSARRRQSCILEEQTKFLSPPCPSPSPLWSPLQKSSLPSHFSSSCTQLGPLRARLQGHPSPPSPCHHRLQTGSYKKLHSPTFSSPTPTQTPPDKENLPPSPGMCRTPGQKVRRCSSLFTPSNRRAVRPLTPAVVGEGRIIPLRQGYMWKWSGTVWRKKYCCLLPGRLVYHSSLHSYLDMQPGKEIWMGSVTVKVPGGRQEEFEGRHTLTIVSLTRQCWTFGCELESRDGWVQALQEDIKTCLQGDVIRGGGLVQAVRSAPGNGVCADCREPDPEWASLNLGVLLCIECSGAHRKLGCHISKVRSLYLDDVDETSLIKLAAVGNRLAALEWEVGLGDSDRVSMGGSREEREIFVWKKYVVRQWRRKEMVGATDKGDNQVVGGTLSGDRPVMGGTLAGHRQVVDGTLARDSQVLGETPW